MTTRRKRKVVNYDEEINENDEIVDVSPAATASSAPRRSKKVKDDDKEFVKEKKPRAKKESTKEIFVVNYRPNFPYVKRADRKWVANQGVELRIASGDSIYPTICARAKQLQDIGMKWEVEPIEPADIWVIDSITKKPVMVFEIKDELDLQSSMFVNGRWLDQCDRMVSMIDEEDQYLPTPVFILRKAENKISGETADDRIKRAALIKGELANMIMIDGVHVIKVDDKEQALDEILMFALRASESERRPLRRPRGGGFGVAKTQGLIGKHEFHMRDWLAHILSKLTGVSLDTGKAIAFHYKTMSALCAAFAASDNPKHMLANDVPPFLTPREPTSLAVTRVISPHVVSKSVSEKLYELLCVAYPVGKKTNVIV